jgi:hypothetical protein
MARLSVKGIFDPKQPLLVRRAFSAAGRTFQPGDAFPWKRLSVSLRRAFLMYESGLLRHSDDADAEETVTEETVTEETVTEETVTEETVTEETVTEENPPAPPIDNSDLDVESLVVLQTIAKREGAAFKSTKAAQRQSIIEKRQG